MLILVRKVIQGHFSKEAYVSSCTVIPSRILTEGYSSKDAEGGSKLFILTKDGH